MISLNQITPEQLSAIAGILLSLLTFYIPRFGPWYSAQSGQTKAQLMGAFIVVAGVGSFALAYFNIGPFTLGTNVQFWPAAWALLLTVAAALIGNQATFTLVNKMRAPASLAAINAHGAFEVADPIGPTRS